MGDGTADAGSRFGRAFDITNENAGPPLKGDNEFDDRVDEALRLLKEQVGEKIEELHKLFPRQES